MRELNDLISEYIEESCGQLTDIEEEIVQVKQKNFDYNIIHHISSVMRSIKRGASFLGLTNIEQLARKVEEILNYVKCKNLEFNSQASSCIFDAIEKLKELLINAGTNVDFDITDSLLELDDLCQGKSFPPFRQIKLESIDCTIILDHHTFETLKNENKKIFHLQFELREVHYRNYNTPLEFLREIEKTGEIIELKVDMDLVLKNESFTGEGIPLDIIYITVLEKEIVAYIFGIDENQVKELNI